MARSNGIVSNRDYLPPPSSMLATHVIGGHGAPKLSRDDFSELLRESLDSKNGGESSIGNNIDVNLKLLSVVVGAGIEPLLNSRAEGPFRKPVDQGRNISELKSCLDVICLTVQRSPETALADIAPNIEKPEDSIPVYSWILSILLSIITLYSNTDILKSCANLQEACLQADKTCACGACGTIMNLTRECLSGTLG